MLNIISGTKKRTKLQVPKNNVRPTSATKRESIFSIIESIANKKNIEIYKNKCFLDIFAGTGCFGLEAISRGLNYCYFFEIDNEVVKILEYNCKKVSNKNNYIIINGDANKSTFSEINLIPSIIFIDPPYKTNPFNQILNNILKADFISKDTIFILESNISTNFDIPFSLKIKDVRKYGKTKISFLSL